MKNIYEVFDEFAAAHSRGDKINVLRKNDSYALRNVLVGIFHPNVHFNVSEPVTFKPSDSPPGMGYSSIHQELDRVYLFEKNNPKANPDLTEKRKREILVQMLESLEAREAEVFLNMLLKRQPVKGLTPKIVSEAFPGLIPAE